MTPPHLSDDPDAQFDLLRERCGGRVVVECSGYPPRSVPRVPARRFEELWSGTVIEGLG